MEKLRREIAEIYLDKTQVYSDDLLRSFDDLENMLEKCVSKDDYTKLEAKINAIYSDYEEETFLYGFREGIKFAFLFVLANQ